MRIEDFNRMLNPIRNSIKILASKAVVTKVQTDVQGERQQVQVDLGNDQLIDGVERIQPYGLSSNLDDADTVNGPETVVISLAGNRDHPVILQADDGRYRVLVSKGDVALYNKAGMVIELKGEQILVGQGLQTALTPLDGVVTGQTIDTLTGIPLGALPGGNDLGTANSQKLKVQL